MNYEDMSDFEINTAVALIVTGGDVIDRLDMAYAPTDDGVQVIYKIGVHGEFFDYCNNPSDAWPIIVDNRISLIHGDDGYEACFVMNYPSGLESTHSNPLRAAMICFLKMKDAEK